MVITGLSFTLSRPPSGASVEMGEESEKQKTEAEKDQGGDTWAS